MSSITDAPATWPTSPFAYSTVNVAAYSPSSTRSPESSLPSHGRRIGKIVSETPL